MADKAPIERLSPDEAAAVRLSLASSRKQDPLRDALVNGDVVFVAEPITSGRIQGLRVWSRKLGKRVIARSANRRDTNGTLIWLVEL